MKKYKQHKETVLSAQDCDVVYETKKSVILTQPDFLDSLTPYQQKSLQLGLNQLNEGNYVPHSKVVKMSDQWLKM